MFSIEIAHVLRDARDNLGLWNRETASFHNPGGPLRGVSALDGEFFLGPPVAVESAAVVGTCSFPVGLRIDEQTIHVKDDSADHELGL